MNKLKLMQPSDEPHEHNVVQKKTNAQVYIVCDFIYKIQNRGK